MVRMTWEDTHKGATIVDLHSHAALKAMIMDHDLGKDKKRWLLKFFERGFFPFSDRVTFPKMEKGGIDVLLSTAYILEREWVKDISLIRWLLRLVPSVRRILIDPSYFDVTNYMLDEMESQIETYNVAREGRVAHLALSVEDLNKGLNAGSMCVVHSIEGAHSLETHDHNTEEELLNNLEHFFNRGVAYLTLAHFYPNKIAYPAFPYPEYALKHLKWKKILGQWDMNEGLTPVGEKVVEKMLELGMLIDIVHCTPKGRAQVRDIASHHNKKNCVIASHMATFEINRDPMNLTDEEIKWMADNGGVIGVILMNYYLAPYAAALGLKHVENNINHIINVGGIDTVGIGTDFDGFTDPPDEIVDMSELPRLTKYLAALGYNDEQLKKLLGGNGLRVLRDGWGKKHTETILL